MLYVFHEFELSEQEFSLSRSGRRISIEPRALRVLLVLVASPGRLLEKKALLDAVWQGTYVEETTLTRAIAVIRKHLEDDPRAPKFIETVPTRGYRFIAPVEIRTTAPDSPASEAIPAIAELPTSAPIVTALPRLPRRRGRTLAIAAGVLCATLLPGGYLLYRQHAKSSFTTKDTIVLADFTNSTNDHVFDDALRQGILVQLEQSPVLRLASDGQIRSTLKLMGLRSDAPVTAEVGREVCQRIGATVVLNGSIAKLGNEYVLGLQARRCSSGEQLHAEQIQIVRKEDALNALSSMATRFRVRIGEASATIRDLDTPLAEATTPSLDALKAFSEGIRNFNAKGSGAAIPLFQQAAELDPEFAEAHVWLGRMYADVGQEAAAIQSTQRAYDLRDRTSYRERLSIDVSWDLLVTGDLEKARAACEAWIQMYPRDVYPRFFLSATISPAYGHYDRALQEAKGAIAADPASVVGYRNAAVNLIALNRVDEAEAVLRQAQERKLFLPGFVTTAYRMAFLKDDADGMKRAADGAPTNPWMLHFRAATLARAGKVAAARALQEQAVNLTRRGNGQEIGAELIVTEALTEALYGYPENAAAQARAALAQSTSRDVRWAAALVLALTQNYDEADKLVADLRRQFPADTLVRYKYLPAIQAAVALGHKQPEAAVQLLQQTTQFEVSTPLYPILLRGQAYLALGQPSQAGVEFKKIIDHPGVVLNDPLANVAQLGMARAYQAQGNKGNAKDAYAVLLKRWSEADASLPIPAADAA